MDGRPNRGNKAAVLNFSGYRDSIDIYRVFMIRYVRSIIERRKPAWSPNDYKPESNENTFF